MKTLSTTLEVSDVTAAQDGGGALLALANAQAPGEAAFGAGMELALARSGDQVVAPEWIQLFPAGPDIVARDGRRWTLRDPQVLVAAFARNRADLPGDIEHATEIKAPKGEEAPAQAWIKEIAVRADRTTWARVEWTAEGKAHVEAKRYRYVSPAFLYTKDGQITRVKSFALTTQPALELPALARDGGPDPTQQQDRPPMKTLAERLAEALGLRAGATDDAIVQAATEQVGLARATQDPARFVPAADHAAALARATTAETALAARDTADKEAAATTLVDQAIADGKVAPASKDHWVALAGSNPEGAAAAIAGMPAVLTPTDKARKPDAAGADANGLSAEQKALCRSLGVTEEAYAATLKEQAQ